MTRMNDVIRRWTNNMNDFEKPLLLWWLFIGPLLVTCSLLLIEPQMHYLGLFAAGLSGLVTIWRYPVIGMLLFILGAVSYGIYVVSFSSGFSIKMWDLLWGGSLLIALIITRYSIKDVQLLHIEMLEERKKALKDFQISLLSFEEKADIEKCAHQKAVEILNEELFASKEESAALLSLVEISRGELSDFYQQHGVLSEQSLLTHQELEQLKISYQHNGKDIDEQKENAKKWEYVASKRLQVLNQLRVALFQAQLNQRYYKSISEKKHLQAVDQVIDCDAQKISLNVKKLDNYKSVLKQDYNILAHDITALQSQMDKMKKIDKSSVDQDSYQLIALLKKKKQSLKSKKLEIQDVERQLFGLKKERQQVSVLSKR